jgi:1D-myo-inositol 3-kinase
MTQNGIPLSFQRVKDDVQRRKMQCISSHDRQGDELRFMKPAGHEQFHASLDAAKITPTCVTQECQWDLSSSPPRAVEKATLPQYAGQPKPVLNSIYEEHIQTVED